MNIRSGFSAPKQEWLRDLKPEFRTFEREDWFPLDIAEIGGVKVETSDAERFVGAQNNFLVPTALSTADLDFGPLTPAEFATLKAEFGGLSEVPYDAEREYEGADFLPPLLQALLTQDLEIPKPLVLPNSAQYAYPPTGEDVPVDLTANCHGTAWESVRAFQGHKDVANIFLGEAVTMDDALNSELFERLGSPSKEQPEALKPGDVVAFSEEGEESRMTMLLHTAVYVGGDLFFEKPNTEYDGEDSPYRLATWSMLTEPVNDYIGGQFTAQTYRPNQPLPEAAGLFASSQLDEWQEMNGALDKPILTIIEPSVGGGVRGLWNTALAAVPLGKTENGRYGLKEFSR